MLQVAAIAEMVGRVVPILLGLITSSIKAHTTGDEAELQALHDQAVAVANSLKPASR